MKDWHKKPPETVRSVSDAMISAERRRNDLPHVAQVHAYDWDTVILADAFYQSESARKLAEENLQTSVKISHKMGQQIRTAAIEFHDLITALPVEPSKGETLETDALIADYEKHYQACMDDENCDLSNFEGMLEGRVISLCRSLERQRNAARGRDQVEVRVVFDGPPSHESGRFVEVEDANGRSINFGEWTQDGTYWNLVFKVDRATMKKGST